ncbi:hypothetical protein Y1Q_0023351 [Alligator mississippiensis]|uniref:Uncharacterized protein n=1 Tax=Alligator mississippiensis TaxID=8496 RepID=A0A151NPQ2_ALLMI|nr:hypothetical protein Y1Q_0023351 [Alligator mississippiensis]
MLGSSWGGGGAWPHCACGLELWWAGHPWVGRGWDSRGGGQGARTEPPTQQEAARIRPHAQQHLMEHPVSPAIQFPAPSSFHALRDQGQIDRPFITPVIQFILVMSVSQVEMKYNFLPIDIESSGSFAIDSSGIRSRPNVFKIAVASLK